MEDWALYNSTYVACLIVGAIGFIGIFANLFLPKCDQAFSYSCGGNLLLIGAAIIAGWASYYIDKTCKKNINSLFTLGVQSRKIADFLSADYTAKELTTLYGFLVQNGTFIFQSLPNGLFPAASSAGVGDVSGYQYVWVRDNIHVAHAHYVCGYTITASRTLCTLMCYFQKYVHRFRDIIEDRETDKKKALAANPMNRPHIRFDGRGLKEISQEWGHAQNDALGYFLWCYCKLAREGVVKLDDTDLDTLAEFPLYFNAIKYWQDEDSGHWEEKRKVEASSIGTVVAGLREFESLMNKKQLWSHPIIVGHKLTRAWISGLREQGVAALNKILPCESIEPMECYRRYDSALLFLIYPLEILSWDKAHQILEDVKTHLQGDYGIRRYLGDSYWFPDYKKVPESERTANVSTNMDKRDAGARLGEEAQWCIFDPIISVIYGQMYLLCKKEGKPNEAGKFLQLQTAYFNRSLSQLTGESKGVPEFRAPEAYYLENGQYVPNDHTPLLWSQANLWLAMHQMRRSLEDRS